MADVLHRPQHEEATRDTSSEVIAKVPASREVREHGRRMTETVPPARTHVRWLGWLPVMLLAFGAMLAALALVTSGGESDDVDVVEWPTVTDGPGSNSLAATAPEVVVIQWPTTTDGPGSNSLAPTTPDAIVIQWPTTTDGPGSNSLAPTTPGG